MRGKREEREKRAQEKKKTNRVQFRIVSEIEIDR